MITQIPFQTTCGIQELTADEVAEVSGGGAKVEGTAAIGAAGAIGAATFGSTWGAMAVGAAFAAAPVAVIGMGALVLFGAYKLVRGA